MSDASASNHATLAAYAVVSLASTGCGGYMVCEGTDEKVTASLPATLAETGLFASRSPDVLGDGVIAFRPRFELWSDGA